MRERRPWACGLACDLQADLQKLDFLRECKRQEAKLGQAQQATAVAHGSFQELVGALRAHTESAKLASPSGTSTSTSTTAGGCVELHPKIVQLREACLGVPPFDGARFWLWTRCRHPNYFCEWLGWLGLCLAATPSLLQLLAIEDASGTARPDWQHKAPLAVLALALLYVTLSVPATRARVQPPRRAHLSRCVRLPLARRWQSHAPQPGTSHTHEETCAASCSCCPHRVLRAAACHACSTTVWCTGPVPRPRSTSRT